MNKTQLATMEEAKAIAKQLAGIGGGVAEIYIPEWLYYRVPEDGDSKFYHYKFNNGAEGFNVGLVRNTMNFFPSRWPLMVSIEVDAASKIA